MCSEIWSNPDNYRYHYDDDELKQQDTDPPPPNIFPYDAKETSLAILTFLLTTFVLILVISFRHRIYSDFLSCQSKLSSDSNQGYLHQYQRQRAISSIEDLEAYSTSSKSYNNDFSVSGRNESNFNMIIHDDDEEMDDIGKYVIKDNEKNRANGNKRLGLGGGRDSADDDDDDEEEEVVILPPWSSSVASKHKSDA